MDRSDESEDIERDDDTLPIALERACASRGRASIVHADVVGAGS